MNDDYSHFVFEDEYDYSQLLTISVSKVPRVLENPFLYNRQDKFNEFGVSAEYYYDIEENGDMEVVAQNKKMHIEQLFGIFPPPVRQTFICLASTIWYLIPDSYFPKQLGLVRTVR